MTQGTPMTVDEADSRNRQNKCHHEENENSMMSMLSKLRSDEELADVILQGQDGHRVFANRCILSVRSPVFRAMLYGNYSEAQREVIPILGYDGKILQGIIDYCYTNDFETTLLLEGEMCDDEWARTIVQFAEAADYFGLTSLQKKIYNLSRERMSQQPELACSFFDAVQNSITGIYYDSDSGNEACEEEASSPTYSILSLKCIRSNPKGALLPPSNGIHALSKEAFTKILQDQKMEADEFTMFQALQHWVNGATTADLGGATSLDVEPKACPVATKPSATMDIEDQMSQDTDHLEQDDTHKRKAIAAEELSKYIKYKRIKASDLCQTVIPSGLVQQNQVMQAFQDQAMEYEQKRIPFSVDIPRVPCWYGTNNRTSFTCEIDHTNRCGIATMFVHCEPMVTGVHSWSIRLNQRSYNVAWLDELGIALTTISVNPDNPLKGLASSLNHDTWIYDTGGRSWCRGYIDQDGLPKLRPGSIITFTLDLQDSGMLLARIKKEGDTEDGTNFLLCDNIFKDIRQRYPNEKSKPSFIPAISVETGASVDFLGFHI